MKLSISIDSYNLGDIDMPLKVSLCNPLTNRKRLIGAIKKRGIEIVSCNIRKKGIYKILVYTKSKLLITETTVEV